MLVDLCLRGCNEHTLFCRGSCCVGAYNADMMQTQKYDMIVQSMIEMGVDVVYPVELPNQSSLTIDGKNCFEPVVC